RGCSTCLWRSVNPPTVALGTHGTVTANAAIQNLFSDDGVVQMNDGDGSSSNNSSEGNVEFPGNDPTKAPEGYEWKGRPDSTLGAKDGNYYNPSTKESLRPDLDYSDPIGPHWDYKNSSGSWFRIFPDGTVSPK
ncbi:MAG: hypothetical protein ACI9XO_004892, partial [Paraglaciecola sp.]